ncbi:MAG: hypothetical protein HOQ24_17330 [Mycobacteriaceae bacterium]|nr:hypothetical protein [Mycobacteriaceae bacterium]
MSNPNDPWSVRPQQQADQPTEQFGAQGHPGQRNYDAAATGSHTADPYEAYGPPAGPNPTLTYPTYEHLLEQQREQAAVAVLPPPPGFGPPPRRNTGMIVGIAVGLGLLLAAVAAAGYLMFGHRGDDDVAAADSTSSAPEMSSPPLAVPSLPHTRTKPGPGIDIGATMGAITANDGSTLSIRGLLGGRQDTIRTTAQTQVVSMTGTSVADLKVGDMVIVQGDKAPDGSITATLIISTSIGK